MGADQRALKTAPVLNRSGESLTQQLIERRVLERINRGGGSCLCETQSPNEVNSIVIRSTTFEMNGSEADNYELRLNYSKEV